MPAIPYRAALDEMLRADALLVLQASNCNEQIPAKVYEYLRAGRPILALTDPKGDTAGVMLEAGLDSVAPLDSARDIAECLGRLIADIRMGAARLPGAQYVAGASRRERAHRLAELFDKISDADCRPAHNS